MTFPVTYSRNDSLRNQISSDPLLAFTSPYHCILTLSSSAFAVKPCHISLAILVLLNEKMCVYAGICSYVGDGGHSNNLQTTLIYIIATKYQQNLSSDFSSTKNYTNSIQFSFSSTFKSRHCHNVTL